MFYLISYLYNTLAIGSILYVFNTCRKRQNVDVSKVTYTNDKLQFHKSMVILLEDMKHKQKKII